MWNTAVVYRRILQATQIPQTIFKISDIFHNERNTINGQMKN